MAVVKITEDNFSEEVKEGTVLLDFWAQWCGPCGMLSPVLEEAAEVWGDSVKIGKVNVDENMKLAEQFSVMSIPLLVVMKDGREITRSVGAQPLDAILDLVGRIQ